MLPLLQLKLYATYQSATPIQGDAYSARAASINTIEYYHTPNGVHYIALLIAFAVIFPLVTSLHIFVIIRGNRTKIKKHIKKRAQKSSKHPIIAASVMLSLTFTTLVCTADVFAIRAAFANNGQAKLLGNDLTALVFLTIIHSVFDFAVFVVLIVNLLMACLFLYVRDVRHNDSHIWHNCYDLCTILFCWGRHKDDETATNETTTAETVTNKTGYKLFSVLYMVMLIPFVCLASHFHYIVIAWVIDPYFAGAIFIMYGVAFFTYLFTFRNFYICLKELFQSPKEEVAEQSEGASEKAEDPVQYPPASGYYDQTYQSPLVINPAFGLEPHCDISVEELAEHNAPDRTSSPSRRGIIRGSVDDKTLIQVVIESDVEPKHFKCSVQQKPMKHKKKESETEKELRFHIEYVFLGYVFGLFMLVGYQAMLSCLLFFLPQNRAIEHAPSRIFSLYQGFAIVIAAFIAYKVFLKRSPHYDQLGLFTDSGGGELASGDMPLLSV